MRLKKENYTHRGLLLSAMILVLSYLHAQSQCSVGVASEPTIQSIISYPNKISQTNLTTQAAWDNLSGLKDSTETILNINGIKFSNTLQLSDFSINVPEGATIKGIRLKFKGHAAGNGWIKDNVISLTSNSTSSENKAGKGYSINQLWAKDTIDHWWMYGGEQDLWSAAWTPNSINNSNFTVNIQLLNISPSQVSALLNEVSLEVFYLALPTYCSTDCITFYTDLDHEAASYFWHIPQGFEMISRSEKNNVIDLKTSYANAGRYTICADALDELGNKIGECCRSFIIRSCIPASIGDLVWNDVNYNGIQDINEPGIKDIKIKLLDKNGLVIANTMTDNFGKYKFTNITEGFYSIFVDVPNIYLTTKNVLTDVSKNSDFLEGTFNTKKFFVTFNQNITDIDFGLVKKLKLGDYVWEDFNHNGIQDINDIGIQNVEVFLYDQNSTLISTTTSDENGIYSFSNLPASKYRLDFKPASSDYLATKAFIGLQTKDSNIDANFTTALLNLENTSEDLSIDAGFYKFGSIGDYVWLDSNVNGIQDLGENGLDNITFILYDSLFNAVDTVISDSEGYYVFEDVAPGVYTIYAEYPDELTPTVFSTNINGSKFFDDGTTDFIVMLSGQNIDDIDLGLIEQKSRICGNVWYDENLDGQKGVDEPIFSNISVALTDLNNAILLKTFTDQNGNYCFNELKKGQYKIQFTFSDEYQLTDPNVGDDLTDSDAEFGLNVAYTDVISLNVGDSLDHVFAGLTSRSSIGDYVWFDTNKNGIQDADELGLENIVVELYDENNILIKSTTTGISPYDFTAGYYQFEKIVRGLYYIKVIPLSFLDFTIAASDTLLNSDVAENGLSPIFSVVPNQNRADIDAGFALPGGGVSGFAWLDVDLNEQLGSNDQVFEGVTVSLYDDNNVLQSTTTTDASGSYLFYPIDAGNYYVVFEDKPSYLFVNPSFGDSDVTGFFGPGSTPMYAIQDGIITSDVDAGYMDGRSKISGFAWNDDNGNGGYDATETFLSNVTAFLLKDNVIIDSVITSQSGQYSFSQLLLGNYQILFSQVAAKSFTIKEAMGVNFLFNSNADENGLTEIYTLGLFSNIIGVNVGYRGYGNISGVVFQDENENGINDDALFLNDVNIELLTLSGTILSSTLTSSVNGKDGTFEFNNFPAGLYQVRAKDPINFLLTSKDATSDDLDSDGSSDGLGFSITDEILLSSSQFIDNVGFGYLFKPLGKICGKVWLDENADGVYDNSETTIIGITVNLYNSDGFLINTVTTDNEGNYCFVDLIASNYTIEIALPASYQFTYPNIGDDEIDSDINIINGNIGKTDVITLGQGENIQNIYVGFANKSSVGDFVWFDTNKNGLQDSGEPGINDVVVKLYSETGILLEETVTYHNPLTGIDGFYSFEGLSGGNYYIDFDQQPDRVPTIIVVNDDIDSDIDENGVTQLFSLGIAEKKMDIDAGYALPAGGISGYIWNDVNKNNFHDLDDPPISNVKVVLYDLTGTLVASVVSNPGGYYQFYPLSVGKYFVVFDTIPTLSFISSGNANNQSKVISSFKIGSTDTIEVKDGIITPFVNAGYISIVGSISGITWSDINGNGVFENNEIPIPNILVKLLKGGEKIDSVFSNDLGLYTFQNLIPSEYVIQFCNGDTAVVLTKKLVGLDTLMDSDANADGFSDPLNIMSFQDIRGINAGYAGYTTVKGISFIDTNENGVNDDGNQGINGLHICLLDEDGEVIATDTSHTIDGVIGSFEFDKIPVGQTKLKIARPLYYIFSPKDQGDDSMDSDVSQEGPLNAYSDYFTLSLGVVKENLGIGLIYNVPENSSISGIAWNEGNINGIRENDEDIIQGVEIILYKNDNTELRRDTSDENGIYSFNNLTEGYYYLKAFDNAFIPTFSHQGSDKTLDCDFDNNNGRNTTSTFYLGISEDTSHVDYGRTPELILGDFVWNDVNGDGIQDVDEPGLENVKIDLLYNGLTYKSTSTLADGFYQFDLIPGSNYVLNFETPTNFAPTPANIGSQELDSNIDALGSVAIGPFNAPLVVSNIDAGFVKTGSIGDKVFVDFNGNGIFNTGEPGMDDVMIDLINGNGQIIATTFTSTDLTTGEVGKYLFKNVVPGLYSIKVHKPMGYLYTTQDFGGDDLDSDVDPTSGQSAFFTVHPNENIKNIDAGIYLPGCIGDKVWLDEDLDGQYIDGDPGIGGVIVNLYNNSGILIQTDTTNSEGLYLFESLKSGLYSVEFIINPLLYDFTIPNNTNDDFDDSDPNAQGKTPLIVLSHGAKYYDLDAGVIPKTNRLLGTIAQPSENSPHIGVSPNPATRFVNLSFEGLKFSHSTLTGLINIYDTGGKLVDKFTIKNDGELSSIDISHFKAGIYHVVLNYGSESYQTKFLKVD